MANGGHFPVQYAYYSGFGLVEDQIVDLIVSMYQGSPVLWLFRLLREKRHHFVEMRNLADLLSRLNVFVFRLGYTQGAKCFQLSVIKSGMSAKFLQAY